ncbi:MAG: TIGR00730 family Rossman fold protein [Prevotellaceae bacterium]|jgi:uncharacterized protein (TIGR00730 family)|nr:TIGR00730 family Rossman fold protein [Prevotellaceae bacterium]
MKTVSIFCSSYNNIDKQYFSDAEEIAKLLVEYDCKIIIGGGANGLMGKIADVATALHGNIEGIRHEELMQNSDEPFHHKIKIREEVKGIEQRKRIMYDEADIILVLPGGAGTLEELFYSITCNRLLNKEKPIIIFNKSGLFDPLSILTKQLVEQGFQTKDYCFTFVRIEDLVRFL